THNSAQTKTSKWPQADELGKQATNNTTTESNQMTAAEKRDSSALDLRRHIGIEYQVLTEDAKKDLHLDDPHRVFHSGEAFRLKLSSNINANLYVIAEDQRSGERRLLFPNFKYQQGSERVKPFTALIVPPVNQPAF